VAKLLARRLICSDLKYHNGSFLLSVTGSVLAPLPSFWVEPGTDLDPVEFGISKIDDELLADMNRGVPFGMDQRLSSLYHAEYRPLNRILGRRGSSAQLCRLITGRGLLGQSSSLRLWLSI